MISMRVSFGFNFSEAPRCLLIVNFDAIVIHGPPRRVLPPALEDPCFRLHHVAEHLTGLAGGRDVRVVLLSVDHNDSL